MTRPAQIALLAALALLGAAALSLRQIHHLQRLGQPGVRVVAQEMRDELGGLCGTNAVALPADVLDWKSVAQPVATGVVRWLPPDTVYGQRLYTAPDGLQVQVNVVLMGADRTSIHKPEYCLPSQGLSIDAKESRTLPVGGPTPYDLPVTVFRLSREVTQPDGTKAVGQALYVFWFVADGQVTADHNQRMRWMARDLITRLTLQRWAYISCLVPHGPGGEEAAFGRLSEFLGAAVPRFQLATPGQVRLARQQAPPPSP
ncbi:MAG: hypothetical protein RJA22_573 [Verrucomicrobiota bacterium]|jgi:hypothetical protein